MGKRRDDDWAGVALALLVVALFAGIFAWIYFQPSYVGGLVEQVEPVGDGGQVVVRLSNVLGTAELLIFHEAVADQAVAGKWVLAKGIPGRVGEWQVLEVEQASSPPLPRLYQLQGWLPFCRAYPAEFLARHRVVALLAAGILLLLGLRCVSALGALAFGVVAAWGAWHLTIIAIYQGWLQPLDPVAVLTVAVLAFALGFLLVWGHPRNALSLLSQRIALLLVVLCFVPAIADGFGWEPDWTAAVAVVVALLSPAAVLWLLASFLLVLAIGAHGVLMYVVMAMTACLVHLLVDGEWVPGRRPFRPLKSSRRILAKAGREVPVTDLLKKVRARKRGAS